MNIKESRINHGLTQKQLSEITGIPERTIQNWEGGQRKCPDYVEKMVLDTLEQKFGQPDYKTILEEIGEMIESDIPHLSGDAKQYAENVLAEIKESTK
jgi:transcriptional regulator with XRE-family HTH domain